jgi:hypothetical protein
MITIYKYTSHVNDKITFQVSKGAQFLSVQSQHELLAFWFIVDNTEPTEERSFVVYGTGHPVGIHTGKHVGTVQHMDGLLVWHIFEEV